MQPDIESFNRLLICQAVPSPHRPVWQSNSPCEVWCKIKAELARPAPRTICVLLHKVNLYVKSDVSSTLYSRPSRLCVAQEAFSQDMFLLQPPMERAPRVGCPTAVLATGLNLNSEYCVTVLGNWGSEWLSSFFSVRRPTRDASQSKTQRLGWWNR